MKITGESVPREIAGELARRIKEYRITENLTQEELAEKAMISRKTLSRFENGSDIGLCNLVGLLQALNLSRNLETIVPDPDERPSFHTMERKEKKRVKHGAKETAGTGFVWGEDR
ncbi:MAG: helix-turn-helix transcriptional regulator [Lachnospiraceae bacterium]|nr:helix-turn-helix transcriptional regulator [Lachnospiraceae bacterium]